MPEHASILGVMTNAVAEPTHAYPFYWVLITTVGIVFCVSAYRYYIAHDYTFLIEQACDPTSDSCGTRDCGIDGNCPPNGLSLYATYRISAGKFSQCADSGCTNICQPGAHECERIACDESIDEACVGPNEPRLQAAE